MELNVLPKNRITRAHEELEGSQSDKEQLEEVR